jgi:CheY-like chemotaxis protein
MLLFRDVERQGHLAPTVADGGQAQEALGAEPFGVVLLDVLMPKMDGCETEQMSRA